MVCGRFRPGANFQEGHKMVGDLCLSVRLEHSTQVYLEKYRRLFYGSSARLQSRFMLLTV
jgi:hypothetical protein